MAILCFFFFFLGGGGSTGFCVRVQLKMSLEGFSEAILKGFADFDGVRGLRKGGVLRILLSVVIYA